MTAHEVPFISASTVPQELLIVSQIVVALTHWETNSRRARLCAYDRCKLCRDGWGTKERYLIRVEDRGGFHSLMELGPRHRDVLRQVSAHQSLGRSAWVEVWKLGSAVNAPVQLDILQVVSLSQLFDLTNLVKKNYLPALEIEAEEGEKTNLPPAPVVSIQDTGFTERDQELQQRLMILREQKT